MDTETADAGFLNARQAAFRRELVAGGSDVAAARPPATVIRGRAARGAAQRIDRDANGMLVIVGECRSETPPAEPTSAMAPP
jgi:hypothetical protein